MARNSFLDAPSFRRITPPSQRRSISRRRSRSRTGGSGTADDPIRQRTEEEIRQARLKQLQSDLSSSGIQLTQSERQAILQGKSADAVRKQVQQRTRKASLAELQSDLSRTGTKLSKQQQQAILEGTPVQTIRKQVERQRGVELAKQRGQRRQAGTIITSEGVKISTSPAFAQKAKKAFGREGQSPEGQFSAPASFERPSNLREIETARERTPASFQRPAPDRVEPAQQTFLARKSSELRAAEQQGSIAASIAEPFVTTAATAEAFFAGGARRQEIKRRFSEGTETAATEFATFIPSKLGARLTGTTQEQAKEKGIGTRPPSDLAFGAGALVKRTFTPKTPEQRAEAFGGAITGAGGPAAIRGIRTVARRARFSVREQVPPEKLFDPDTLKIVEKGGRAFPTVTSVDEAVSQFRAGASERGGFTVLTASPQPLRGASKGRVTAGEGPGGAADLETTGIFTAPERRGSPRFLGVGAPQVTTGVSLLPDTAPQRPTVSRIRVPEVERIPEATLAQGVAAENQFLREVPRGSAFVTGNLERAFNPRFPGRATAEAEAVVAPGTLLQRVRPARRAQATQIGGFSVGERRFFGTPVDVQEFDVIQGGRVARQAPVTQRPSRVRFSQAAEADFDASLGLSGSSSRGLRPVQRVGVSAVEPASVLSRASRPRRVRSSRSFGFSSRRSAGVSSRGFSVASSPSSAFSSRSGVSSGQSLFGASGPSSPIGSSGSSITGSSAGRTAAGSSGRGLGGGASGSFISPRSRTRTPPPNFDFTPDRLTRQSDDFTPDKRSFEFESSILGIEAGKKEKKKRETGFTGLEVRGI